MLDPRLIHRVLSQYQLRPRGLHGPGHWARVHTNGALLCELTGARADVVELFALFHDCRRFDEGFDSDHGPRAAELVREVRGAWFELDDEGLELLAIACRDHSRGLIGGDVTVRTCWDADRLDLYRVGIRPHPNKLCTEAARDPRLIEAAVARSDAGYPQLAQTWAEVAGLSLEG